MLRAVYLIENLLCSAVACVLSVFKFVLDHENFLCWLLERLVTQPAHINGSYLITNPLTHGRYLPTSVFSNVSCRLSCKVYLYVLYNSCKPEGKRPLRRPRRRWVDNIRMDLQEVGCGYVDWTGLAQDRDSWRTLVSAVMNLRVPWNAGNFLSSCKPVSCSGRTVHHGVSK